MGLKRKASFTTITSPKGPSSPYQHATSPIPFPGDVITMDETPRHLHSRTRKRFRNDRPDEQSVYDKTLRWLFSAQQQQHYQQSTPLDSEPTSSDDDTPSLPQYPVPDSRQQTLTKFFQPRPKTAHPTTVPSEMNPQTPLRSTSTPQLNSAYTSNNSLSSSPSAGVSEDMDVDVNMGMDIDNCTPPHTPEKRWVGGIGWM